MPSRLLAVFLQYSNAHHDSGMRALSSLVARLFPAHEPSFVIVDNKLDKRHEVQLRHDTNLISGDNSCREFSGYDRGLRWHESFGEISPDTPVVIANDTFNRHYGEKYLGLFTAARVSRTLRSNGVLGYVDAFPQPQSVFGHAFQKWIRTSLFIAPYGVMRQLAPFGPRLDHKEIFRQDADPAFFSEGAPLSPWYQSFLRSWLFAEAPKDETFKPEWHSKEPLTETNVDAMRAKTCCILCEHLMSAKAMSLEIPLVAVNEDSLPAHLR